MASTDWRFFAVRLTVAFLVSILFLGSASVAFAGFGISPPYVENHRLTRGSVYHQTINLVRSDPTEDLKTEITMNTPGIEHWFSVDKGKEFILPKGVTQIPIVVEVRVPNDAEYKEYKGAIRVRTSAANPQVEGGGVSIALGAQIDVALEVVDKILDFMVRRVNIADLEEGRRKWGLFFPGKIRFVMMIENTGNAVYGPTKVVFEIYDSEMETLLETTENTNKMEEVAPFATQEILAELPTRLSAGRYTAKYAIYKGDEIAAQDTINVSILPIGTIPGYEGYGFVGLSLADKLKVAGVVGVPLVLILALVAFVVWRRRRVSAFAPHAPRRF
jgi:hypothetical protein